MLRGIEEIQKRLKGIEESLDPNTFNEWANRIAITAKQLCNDPDCKRIKIINTGQGRVTYQFTDKEAVDCVIKSIESHLNSMPDAQRKYFKILVGQFETKKSEFKTSA
jgi:hypothetical protein